MIENNHRVSAIANDALGKDDAVAVAERIASGEISAGEATDAAIHRLNAVNPQLNALVCERFNKARTEAAQPPTGLLSGVPTLLKDNTDFAGLPTRHGSRATPAGPVKKDAGFTRQFRASGMIVLAKSALPEMGLTPTTEFSQSEPARNPWHTDYSTGGSSGGSAAMVAAGAIPIAHANDGGGSIRIPASCCGLVGLKPSRGRLVNHPVAKALPINLVADGVVSRTVRDTATFFAAAEQYQAAANMPPIGHVQHAGKNRLKIALATHRADGQSCDPECLAAAEQVAGLCESLGHQIEAVQPLFDEQLADDFLLYWAAIAAAFTAIAGHVIHHDRLEPLTRDLARYFTKNVARLPFAIRRLQRATAIEKQLFAQYDLLLTPTLATPPPHIGHLALDLPFETAYERLFNYAAFTPVQNVTGAPAISLPLAQSKLGLPIGLQFAAPLGCEKQLLELAYELEEANPWQPLWK